jgi:hypothetical protein
VLRWLETAFGARDDLQVVAVFFETSPAQFVTRADVLAAVSEAQAKGEYGLAQHQELPGRSRLAPLAFECPVDEQRFTVYYLEPGGPPDCPRHPGATLRSVA